MPALSYDHLLAACSAGGSSALTSVTELAPAGGMHTGVAPARYVDGSRATFAFETRFIDGEPVKTVIIDQKQSTLNRIEAAVCNAIDDGHPLFDLVPRVQVSYGDEVYSDLQLPHRVFDGHIRAGTVDGRSVTAHDSYRAARNATPGNARALLEFAPTALVLGAWDASRRTRQGRYRSSLVGEVIGVLADQTVDQQHLPRRGGARVDPVAASVQLKGDDLKSLAEAQREELSLKLIGKIDKASSTRGEKENSGSVLGLGAIPPSLESLGVVACRRIIRTHVLSFATLRQLRFGAGPAGDSACRTLLAAFALAGLARSDAELYLRANCDLIENDAPAVRMDARNGNSVDLEPLTVDETDTLLATALDEARSEAGIRWEGQVFDVTGNPVVYATATADTAGE
ncbi:type I-U CRISPR-associated RAMP protein Csb1/Cas7u [Nocardia sp. BMG51109]|uniref:type I-G CRISPR-associated RAMP protein Csb1/Cas7g n=1 Tax=Nocardia sp. BMG51109 TaxID=1056816 RepID=UPI000466B0AC|nr:type I-U CRISPR-associated RAMP protein Csb1/Cas7u [Nocardia sp. BMG51109]